MGSSLSPPLANIFKENFEQVLMNDIPVEMRPTLWLRYVDDVFCCYEDMAKFETFLHKLNNIRPIITFTVEMSKMTSGPLNIPGSEPESLPFVELSVM